MSKQYNTLGVQFSSNLNNNGIILAQTAIPISSQSYTAILWFNPISATDACLFALDNGTNISSINWDPNQQQAFMLMDSNITYIGGNGGSGFLSIGTWFMAAVSCSGSVATGYSIRYYDKHFASTSATNTAVDTGLTAIIGNKLAGGFECRGNLVGAIIYNHQLFESEIINQSRQLAPLKNDGLLAWLPMRNVQSYRHDVTGRFWTDLGTALTTPRNAGSLHVPVPEIINA